MSLLRRLTRAGSTSPTVQAPRRWRPSSSTLVVAVLALAGMLLYTYPTAASWVSRYHQSKVVADYLQEVTEAPDTAAQLRQARAYNQALSSGAVLESDSLLPASEETTGSAAYNSVLDANGAGLMARLRIPSIDLDLPVYHGTSESTLLQGLGHLEGTSLPVGGTGTHAVITGHRGLASATMFTNLDKVQPGDTFTIEVFGEVLTYRVVETTVVRPDQTEALRPDPDRDLVTLVTCTPLGINTHRILVTGERVIPTPPGDLAWAATAPEALGFPWWLMALGGGVVVDAGYLWRSGYDRQEAEGSLDSRDQAARRPARGEGVRGQGTSGPSNVTSSTRARHARVRGPGGVFHRPRGRCRLSR